MNKQLQDTVNLDHRVAEASALDRVTGLVPKKYKPADPSENTVINMLIKMCVRSSSEVIKIANYTSLYNLMRAVLTYFNVLHQMSTLGEISRMSQVHGKDGTYVQRTIFNSNVAVFRLPNKINDTATLAINREDVITEGILISLTKATKVNYTDYFGNEFKLEITPINKEEFEKSGDAATFERNEDSQSYLRVVFNRHETCDGTVESPFDYSIVELDLRVRFTGFTETQNTSYMSSTNMVNEKILRTSNFVMNEVTRRVITLRLSSEPYNSDIHSKHYHVIWGPKTTIQDNPFTVMYVSVSQKLYDLLHVSNDFISMSKNSNTPVLKESLGLNIPSYADDDKGIERYLNAIRSSDVLLYLFDGKQDTIHEVKGEQGLSVDQCIQLYDYAIKIPHVFNRIKERHETKKKNETMAYIPIEKEQKVEELADNWEDEIDDDGEITVSNPYIGAVPEWMLIDPRNDLVNHLREQISRYYKDTKVDVEVYARTVFLPSNYISYCTMEPTVAMTFGSARSRNVIMVNIAVNTTSINIPNFEDIRNKVSGAGIAKLGKQNVDKIVAMVDTIKKMFPYPSIRHDVSYHLIQNYVSVQIIFRDENPLINRQSTLYMQTLYRNYQNIFYCAAYSDNKDKEAAVITVRKMLKDKFSQRKGDPRTYLDNNPEQKDLIIAVNKFKYESYVEIKKNIPPNDPNLVLLGLSAIKEYPIIEDFHRRRSIDSILLISDERDVYRGLYVCVYIVSMITSQVFPFVGGEKENQEYLSTILTAVERISGRIIEQSREPDKRKGAARTAESRVRDFILQATFFSASARDKMFERLCTKYGIAEYEKVDPESRKKDANQTSIDSRISLLSGMSFVKEAPKTMLDIVKIETTYASNPILSISGNYGLFPASLLKHYCTDQRVQRETLHAIYHDQKMIDRLVFGNVYTEFHEKYFKPGYFHNFRNNYVTHTKILTIDFSSQTVRDLFSAHLQKSVIITERTLVRDYDEEDEEEEGTTEPIYHEEEVTRIELIVPPLPPKPYQYSHEFYSTYVVGSVNNASIAKEWADSGKSRKDKSNMIRITDIADYQGKDTDNDKFIHTQCYGCKFEVLSAHGKASRYLTAESLLKQQLPDGVNVLDEANIEIIKKKAEEETNLKIKNPILEAVNRYRNKNKYPTHCPRCNTPLLAVVKGGTYRLDTRMYEIEKTTEDTDLYSDKLGLFILKTTFIEKSKYDTYVSQYTQTFMSVFKYVYLDRLVYFIACALHINFDPVIREEEEEGNKNKLEISPPKEASDEPIPRANDDVDNVLSILIPVNTTCPPAINTISNKGPDLDL